MLFCHKIHYIFMINALLSQNLVDKIYTYFLPIFLGWQIVSANFFRFLDVWSWNILWRWAGFEILLTNCLWHWRIGWNFQKSRFIHSMRWHPLHWEVPMLAKQKKNKFDRGRFLNLWRMQMLWLKKKTPQTFLWNCSWNWWALNMKK